MTRNHSFSLSLLDMQLFGENSGKRRANYEDVEAISDYKTDNVHHSSLSLFG